MNLQHDPKARAAAEKLLRFFPATAVQRGQRYWSAGRVKNYRYHTSGFTATVMGLQPCHVNLQYYYGNWNVQCSCAIGYQCEHIYAAMSGWLGLAAAEGTARVPAPAPGTFAHQVATALGRKLKIEEFEFLEMLGELAARFQTHLRLYANELSQLGLHIRDFSYGPLPLRPMRPNNEHEFWLLIVEYLSQTRAEVPEFMRPVSDLGAMRKRIAEFEREQEIERWRLQLEEATRREIPAAEKRARPLDLQVMFEAEEACLLWQQDATGPFTPVPPSKMKALQEGIHSGRWRATVEALAIWQVVCGEENFHYSPREAAQILYDDPQGSAVLARLVENEALRSRLVGPDGQPLRFQAETLAWQLREPVDGEDVYELALTRPDGTPPPHLLVALPSRPPFYVSAQGLFPCGEPATGLSVRAPNHIPCRALETRAGLRLIQQLALPMPQRLREKIRTVTLEPHVSCKIEPLYPGSPTEKCVFRLTASAGRVVEDWDGAAWVERGNQKGENDLLMVDRSQADQVAALMAPLELKAEPFGKALARKINKQFPDLFSQWLQSLPAFCKVELHGELEQFRNASVSGVVHLEVEEDSLDWFNLKVVVKVEDVNLTPEEIRLLLNAKGRFVRLPEKGWRRLEFDLSAEEDAQLARLGLSPHELSDQPQRLHALQLADPAARRFLADDQAKRVELRAADIKARVTPEIPAGIQATLRPYQRDGFHFLAYLTANHFGGILADDMGLGKTLQALTWLKWHRETLPAPIPPSLVVCPKSVMDNWHAEAERFVPGLRVKIWTASEFAGFQNGLATADLHVINYSQLRLAEDVIKAAAWLVVILDEGQFIKNPNSQTAQAARALKAQYRLVLSGTPIENRLLDLWSLMAFAMPGLLGTRAEFGRIYDAKNDPLARQRLSARVRPFLLRRTKTQVAKDLPDRIEEDIYCELEGEQKTLYRAELKAAQQLLLKVQTQKELNQYRFNFLTSLLRLRQICCHPALVDPKSKLIGAKTEALFDQLEPLMEEGQKVLVFSQFVELINLLDPMIQARQWPVFRLTGETENRGDLVKAFQKQDGPAVFLLSLKAGGFGLNLTSAGYVVLFDPWWNPAVERQAIDRTHRIGQTRKVIAYRLLIKDSIEEKIRRLQKQKAALAEDVLGEEKFAQNLTMADLRYLFSDAPTAAA